MNFLRSFLAMLLFLCFICCGDKSEPSIDPSKLSAMGHQYKEEYTKNLSKFEARIAKDSTDVEALLGSAEMQVYLFIFGLSSRKSTMPEAKEAFAQAWSLDSLSGPVQMMSGIINFLDWNWEEAKKSFENAIQINPKDPKTRHWYSLLLTATTGDLEQAMLQSDTIMSLDPSGDYQVGRGSLLYFARRNEELRDLMLKTIAQDPAVPWGYDWLGMAYIELKDYENSIDTYLKAFDLSDGLVEVGGGLGHALGFAGYHESAQLMADYYDEMATEHYLPPVQRAFIHIGLGDNDRAIELLQQAYAEQSWFIIFMQIEPWYDPIRGDPRFSNLIEKMNFPN